MNTLRADTRPSTMPTLMSLPRWPAWLHFNHLVLRATCWAKLGHDDEQRYDPARLYLVCRNCGRETSGWVMAERRPAITRRITRSK